MAQYTRRSFATTSIGVPTHLRHRLPAAHPRPPSSPPRSRQAKLRLQILTYAETHSVAATCRHFGIARSTYYRWKERYVPARVGSLENRSSRPQQTRRPTWSTQDVLAVRDLRQQFPRMGKDKLAILLRQQGVTLSVSMVGRILIHLKRTHQLIEAPSAASWKPHARHARPYAIRKPPDYTVERPGDLVQVDTMELRPLPGMIRHHFTAVDLVSRFSISAVRYTASAGTARDFLDQLIARLPPSVRAIQVDGGSEFMAEFETACQDRAIRLFVLPPRSPKLNGTVERTNRTYRSEFYECYGGPLDLPSLQTALGDFEQTYNHLRPHQALGYRTPAAVLAASGHL
jgi:transposase InsO family protein